MREVFFNGYRLNDDFEILAIRRDILPPRTLVTQEVPGLPGVHLIDVKRGPRVTEVDVLILDEDYESLQNRITSIAGKIDTTEPAELRITDEPNITRMAIIDGETALQEILRSGMTTLSFFQPDPYSYGPELTATFPSDVVTLTNNGTAPADPIFELEILDPVTFAMIQNQDGEYMMIGKPVSVEETEFEREQLIMHNPLASTVGWTSGDQVDNGVVAGSMISNGYQFRVSDYGTGPNWHGPALKTSLPEVLQDFRIEVLARLNTFDPNQMARVEVYLLDESNNIIAKIGMRDAHAKYSINYGEARVKDVRLIGEYGDQNGVWNDFFGMFRFQRIGNEWTAYIAKLDSNGRHFARREVSWPDDGRGMQQVAQIQLHIGAHADRPTPGQSNAYFEDVKVWKINQTQDNEIPYIAQPGDIITFDHASEELLINGEDRSDLKDFGATYFKLKQGTNNLVVHPFDSFNVSVKYRERFR